MVMTRPAADIPLDLGSCLISFAPLGHIVDMYESLLRSLHKGGTLQNMSYLVDTFFSLHFTPCA